MTLDKAQSDSAAAVTVSDSQAYIDVSDSRGINGLTARLAQGDWPEEVTVLLRLRGLERLEIRYGDYTIMTGRSSNDSPDPPLILYVTDENGEISQAPVSANIYFPEIGQSEDGFSISLSPHFFHAEYPSFSMQWIDFYRQ